MKRRTWTCAGRTYRRRGTLYLAVLGTSMLIGVIGISALLAVRVRRRAVVGDQDLATARLNAQAALGLGLLTVQNNSSWRTAQSNGPWLSNVVLSDGTLSLFGVDPVDGNLANSPADPLVLTGVGDVRGSRYILVARYEPVTTPLDALKTCLHSGGNISVSLASTMTVSGGPLSANGAVTVSGNIVGDVEANSVDQPARVSGKVTAPAPTKALPAATVFATYQALATSIPLNTNIDKAVISRASNPWGTPNGDGVYYMDATGNDVWIRRTRLYGTLVVKCQGKTLQIDQQVLFEPYRTDYPVLIVDGNLNLAYDSGATQLLELLNANYNPVGTPYGGATDSDQLDSYPSEIRGLVYVTGTLTIQNTAWVRGVVVCNGNVTCSGTNKIIYDDQSYKTPPPGFTQTTKLALKNGSFKRVLSTP